MNPTDTAAAQRIADELLDEYFLRTAPRHGDDVYLLVAILTRRATAKASKLTAYIADREPGGLFHRLPEGVTDGD